MNRLGAARGGVLSGSQDDKDLLLPTCHHAQRAGEEHVWLRGRARERRGSGRRCAGRRRRRDDPTHDHFPGPPPPYPVYTKGFI